MYDFDQRKSRQSSCLYPELPATPLCASPAGRAVSHWQLLHVRRTLLIANEDRQHKYTTTDIAWWFSGIPSITALYSCTYGQLCFLSDDVSTVWSAITQPEGQSMTTSCPAHTTRDLPHHSHQSSLHHPSPRTTHRRQAASHWCEDIITLQNTRRNIVTKGDTSVEKHQGV